MARVVRFHKVGGPEVLQVEEVEVPQPGKGEVQIRVKALGLNRAESMFRRGEYIEQPNFPARIGYEAAGTVAAVGPGVEGFKVGDARNARTTCRRLHSTSAERGRRADPGFRGRPEHWSESEGLGCGV